MAGWLDALLGEQGGAALPPPALFPGEQVDAESARQAMQDALTARRAARDARVAARGPGTMAVQEPVPFSAGMLSPYGINWPMTPSPAASGSVSGSVASPTAPDMPPSTNDPFSREPVIFKDGVPLPRPKPPGVGEGPDLSPGPNAPFSMAPQGEESTLPQGATSTGPMPLPPAAPQANPQAEFPGPVPAPGGLGNMGGVLGRIFNPANAPLLLALGGGLSGAPSLGTGIRRGASAAAPAAALLRREQITEGGIAESYRALVARGVNPQEALAAVRNPDIMKAVVAKYFETKPLTVHMIKDPIGGETPVVFNPTTGRFQDMTGRPISQEQMASGGVAGGGVPGGVLAPGVTFDPNATGEAYLAQFNKDVQAAVKAYMNGDVMPTGNPRQRSISTFAKNIAQRYGQDTGQPIGETIYAQRRNYRAQLGSNSATSAGGQAKAFNQGIEHADALATQLLKLSNYDPLGIKPLAHWINMARGLRTEQASVVNEVNTIGQTLAGEVGKLFSGSSGGGVHERDLTRSRFNPNASPRELAGALAGTIETMEGGLKALEQRRDEVLGPNNNVNFVTPETQAKIARIKEVIAQLRGERPAAPAAAAAPAAPAAPTAAPAPGRYVLDPASGRLVPQQ